MRSLISLSDLFVVGIGLDIAGAFLLTKGLLLGDEQILGKAGAYYGANPHQVVASVDDRIAGVVGVTALVLGFVFQLAGYFANSSISSSATSTSLGRGIVTVAIAVAAIAVVAIAHRIVRPHLRRRQLVSLAKYDTQARRADRPFGFNLVAYGQAAGLGEPNNGESQAEYALRIWNVGDITEGLI